MKKILCVSLILTIIISLFGCSALGGAQATQPASSASPASSAPSAASPAASLSPSPSAAAAQSASPKATLSLIPSTSPSASATDTGLTYQNAEYGFSFSLPASWKGYTIVASKWQGNIQDSKGTSLTQTGPELLIRHPKWTEKNPWQDIPIMIFTPAQWSDIQADKLHIGAAPINPTELGHNSKYVFALPARYNYAFPTGFEEVDALLKTNPLHANEEIGDVS